ncbi:hypothetical protein ACIHAX_37030 [Nocardia sp. NPDC051929]|uniref:hypothetical protein n=1 Tax=Nocardia sp. NPDC051929 TaxID=3364327 RepID=UPI0037CC6A96
MYRRKVDIDKDLANAAAFIDASGHAQRDYIALRPQRPRDRHRHRTRARRPPASRPLYEPAPALRPGDGIDAAPIYDRTGAVVEEVRPPADERLVNEVVL